MEKVLAVSEDMNYRSTDGDSDIPIGIAFEKDILIMHLLFGW